MVLLQHCLEKGLKPTFALLGQETRIGLCSSWEHNLFDKSWRWIAEQKKSAADQSHPSNIPSVVNKLNWRTPDDSSTCECRQTFTKTLRCLSIDFLMGTFVARNWMEDFGGKSFSSPILSRPHMIRMSTFLVHTKSRCLRFYSYNCLGHRETGSCQWLATWNILPV